MKERHHRVGTCDCGTHKLDASVWGTIEIQMVN